MTLSGDDDITSIRYSGRAGSLRLWLMRFVKAIICTSPPQLASLVDAPSWHGFVLNLPKGVDTRAFSPATREEKRSIRSALSLDPDAPLVLFCGSLIYRKGVDILLDAWELVSARHPLARLLLVGPDSHFGLVEHSDKAEARQIEERLASGQLRQSVIATGYRSDVHTLFRAADLFVFPSRREGFGNVIIEAMACGLPSILANLDGISRYLLGTSGGGIVVDTADPRDYAHAMCDLIGNTSRLDTMGRLARQRALDRFALDRIADAYVSFFHEVLQARLNGSDASIHIRKG
jgi:glycosyltransferase involved in cell wall biosynthesis